MGCYCKKYNLPYNELSFSTKLKIAKDHILAILPIGFGNFTQEVIWLINIYYLNKYCSARETAAQGLVRMFAAFFFELPLLGVNKGI